MVKVTAAAVKVTAAALLTCMSVMDPAFAQTVATPPSEIRDSVPVFRVTVVGRSTSAVNYRPRKGDTRVDFVGTALLPRMRGKAIVSGEKGYMKIDAKLDELPSPTMFGAEYLTYVLWAITPEGRATNLGEVQVRDEHSHLEVTTELQAFGLIVTAEPYFAVTQPSDLVVVENVVRDGTNGRIETIQAQYELLKRGTYLMNQDVTRLKIKRLEPGAPLDLAEARNAVELARLAGADKYAGETFGKAASLLDSAEKARERRKKGNEVQMPARQAVQTAEDARLIALQRQEQELIAQERARAAQREREALDRAKAEELRRLEAERAVQAEQARLREAQLAAQAEEARRRQMELDAQSAAAARAIAERDRAAAEAARLAAEREKANAADAARAEAEAARLAADAARRLAEQQAQQAQSLVEQAQRERDELRENLRKQLNEVLETRETARGLVVNLSDVLFDFDKSTLRPGAREKLSRVAGILSAHPGLGVTIEGHTDSIGTDDYNQRLSESRARSVSTYLSSQGIGREIVGTAGFGESRPVASNDNAAGRQQNRRVELVVSGDAIAKQ